MLDKFMKADEKSCIMIYSPSILTCTEKNKSWVDGSWMDGNLGWIVPE